MSKLRPILYSPAMVRALLGGFKTQTRRLATSPLAKAEIGDVLYVRECFRAPQFLDHVAPRNFSPHIPLYFEADVYDDTFRASLGRLRPAMHMPQIFSRICLTVSDKRFQPLNSISVEEALAEGVRFAESWQVEDISGSSCGAFVSGFGYCEDIAFKDGIHSTARGAFKALWNSLHGNIAGETWDDNPEIVALTFTPHFQNFETLQAA